MKEKRLVERKTSFVYTEIGSVGLVVTYSDIIFLAFSAYLGRIVFAKASS